MHSDTGRVFAMHTHTCTQTHTDRHMCREGWSDGQTAGKKKRPCRPGTSSAAGPDVDKGSLFSTGIHPQTACPPRRPLAFPATTDHLLLKPHFPPSCLLFSTAVPPYTLSTWLWPISIPGKTMRTKGGRGGVGVGGGGRCRETRRDVERDDDRREKREEKETCRWEAGAPNDLPADWTETFHSPAAPPIGCWPHCAGVFVHSYGERSRMCKRMCV